MSSDTQRGLTDDDYERIREATQDDSHNMAYTLSDDPKRAGRVENPVPREPALWRGVCAR